MAKFQPGQSGNPGGRPKEDAEFKLLAKQKSEAALNLLVSIMENKKKPDDLRVKCAIAVIERAHGKPLQEVKGIAANLYSQVWTGAARRAQSVDARGRVNFGAKAKSADESGSVPPRSASKG